MNVEAASIGITPALARWFAELVGDGDPERTLRDLLAEAMMQRIERDEEHTLNAIMFEDIDKT
jgi:hypothetical protein